MHKTTSLRRWLMGATAGALAALIIASASRWLVWNQVSLVLGGGLPELSGSRKEAKAAAASTRPDDVGIQIAYAFVSDSDSRSRTPKLRLLKERFPNEPALYATILRSACQGEVTGTQRIEEHLLTAKKDEDVSGVRLHPPAPEKLVAFDADAARGEELDPDNAFFPFLRSVGLFAANRDDEALAAVYRAASKPRWEEYVPVEAEGQLRLSEAAFGRRPAIAKTAIYAALLFPQYAAMRSSARMTAYKAIEMEKAGDIEGGIKTRLATMRIGDLMRAQGRSLITSLVGIAIEAIGGLSSPGGERIVKQKDESSEALQARRQEIFFAFLRRNGHAEDADWARTVLEVAVSSKLGIQTSVMDESSPFGRPLWRLLAMWGANILLMGSALWILFLGGGAALACRTRAVREGRPLSVETKLGIWGALALSLPLFFFLSEGLSQGFIEGCAAAIFLAATVLCCRQWGIARCLPVAGVVGFAAWKGWIPLELFLAGVPIGLAAPLIRLRSMVRTGIPASLISGLIALMGFATLGMALYWQARGLREIGSVWVMIGVFSENSNVPVIVAVLGLAAVPFLLTLFIAGISLYHHVPLAAGLCRGFRGVAVPTACVLLLGYCGTAIATVRMERVVDGGLDQTLAHEGRYLASLAGREWAPVVEPVPSVISPEARQ